MKNKQSAAAATAADWLQLRPS